MVKTITKKPTRQQGADAEARYQTAQQRNTARARSALTSAETELDKSGLRMPSTQNVGMGGDSLRRGVQAVGVLARRGARAVQGKPSAKELGATIDAAKRYLSGAAKSAKVTPPGPGILSTSKRDEKQVKPFSDPSKPKRTGAVTSSKPRATRTDKRR
jgi:hypothetical protein